VSLDDSSLFVWRILSLVEYAMVEVKVGSRGMEITGAHDGRGGRGVDAMP
jgi:hypothetical protein